ncbi:uncharacterized protein BT62DRAFT_470094 [Guyanagaster necrorhizus]|uniref:C2H2-type domain-containing protein n=1 Tax=Guyanagaster necrorhizus TaxID=856835 RepID=A0A9P8ANF2_9AGAR|nr:uncharacterized protein BT62DRAFT_470094 [Guyanagaster necrorhizus MCA 3950]KAG7441681.1 hypothetical protein BT62DRAFT_470094 [Guyanagaster necrorhizus MCA 3950]
MHHCPMSGCYFASLQRGNLKVHLNVMHLRVKNLVCHECEPVYETGDPSNMTRHKIKMHGQPSKRRLSKTKGIEESQNLPVDSKSRSPSPSPPPPPPNSPPASSGASTETLPERRLSDYSKFDFKRPVMLHSWSTKDMPLKPRSQTIFGRPSVPVLPHNGPPISSHPLGTFTNLRLPRPPLPIPLASPFFHSQPGEYQSTLIDTSTEYTHFRRNSERYTYTPSMPTYFYNDRRYSEPHISALPSSRRPPSHMRSTLDSPLPQFRDPFQPGRELQVPSSSSSSVSSRASSATPSVDCSPALMPAPKRWVVTVPPEPAHDSDGEIHVRFLGNNVVSTRRESTVWPTPGA